MGSSGSRDSVTVGVAEGELVAEVIPYWIDLVRDPLRIRARRGL
jgi:hypothetical protein